MTDRTLSTLPIGAYVELWDGIGRVESHGPLPNVTHVRMDRCTMHTIDSRSHLVESDHSVDGWHIPRIEKYAEHVTEPVHIPLVEPEQPKTLGELPCTTRMIYDGRISSALDQPSMVLS